MMFRGENAGRDRAQRGGRGCVEQPADNDQRCGSRMLGRRIFVTAAWNSGRYRPYPSARGGRRDESKCRRVHAVTQPSGRGPSSTHDPDESRRGPTGFRCAPRRATDPPARDIARLEGLGEARPPRAGVRTLSTGWERLVDDVSARDLSSSVDKFDSRTGWPTHQAPRGEHVRERVIGRSSRCAPKSGRPTPTLIWSCVRRRAPATGCVTA